MLALPKLKLNMNLRLQEFTANKKKSLKIIENLFPKLLKAFEKPTKEGGWMYFEWVKQAAAEQPLPGRSEARQPKQQNPSNHNPKQGES